jgi:hypothetical protein
MADLKRTKDPLAWVKQKAADAQKKEQEREVSAPCKVVQLPIWPEPTRGVPNIALRSALFGAIRKGARPYLERVEIHSQEGFRLRYTGARLDQGDLDGWETVLHVVRVQALGSECRVTAYQLLKAMGKTDTGGNREVLDKRLARMKATALEVQAGRYSYMGSLIDEVYKDEESREYVIRLNPKMRALFELDQFTQIDWTVRHALDGQPLAQWLHGYYASHAKPYPVNMATLLKLSGSENEEPRSSRQKLRKALDALTDASETNGQPFSYDIRGDLVHVEKKPNGTQRRHLVKKKAPLKKPRS